MEGILIFLLGYLILFSIWMVFILLFYALSYVSRKNLVVIPFGLTQLISFGIQLFLIGYAFYIVWQLITSHAWVFLILAFIFGGFILSFWGAIYELILVPFKASSLYFMERIERANFDGEIIAAEILDKDNKVIGITDGSSTDKRLAIFFLIDYGINLLYVITHPQQYQMIAWWDYLITPMFFMAQNIIIFGIIIGVYNKIRHHKFIWRNKKHMFIKILIADLIFVIGIQAFAIIYLFILAR